MSSIASRITRRWPLVAALFIACSPFTSTENETPANDGGTGTGAEGGAANDGGGTGTEDEGGAVAEAGADGGTTAVPIGVGSGKDGKLDVIDGEATLLLQTFAYLQTAVTQGEKEIVVADTIAEAGDVVMLWRTQSNDVPNGNPRIELGGASVGQYELVRVTSVGGPTKKTLALESALTNGYPSGATLVLRVPQYTDVHVPAGTVLRPVQHFAPDGAGGGIVAFLASGTVTIDGAIDVSGFGYAGGDNNNSQLGTGNCNGDDGAIADGFAPKGISVVRDGGTPGGVTPNANGGGGGKCESGAGGAGGGHASAGIDGNPNANGNTTGGHAGLAVSYDAGAHLVMGGGGGACTSGKGGGAGGAGGGVVFLRAHDVAGTGAILANGAAGLHDTLSSANTSGGGGGGAGGLIFVDATFTSCITLSAAGADGGTGMNNGAGFGAGGKGGKGVLALSSQPVSCP